MPEPVLRRAAEEMLSVNRSGMSAMEMSHRSPQFGEILDKAEEGLRSILNVPKDYRILFLQGGATLQFSMVPMNLLPEAGFAEYVVTGTWGKKAAGAATSFGGVRTAYSGEQKGFTVIPDQDEMHFSRDAAYVHYVSNETIDGVEFSYDLDGGGIPVVCDASSNILSKPIDVERYGVIYAGAQKNIGPSGVTIVIVRNDLLYGAGRDLPPIFDLAKLAAANSMVNTPNTWGIYLIGLVCDWVAAQGGLTEMKRLGREKAGLLYNVMDSSDGYFKGRAEKNARSMMNVTFDLPSPDLTNKFLAEAEQQGMVSLAGHRSVGGIRASIYNAFPKEGVERLASFMKDFAAKNG